MTLSRSPQCRAFSRALMDENSLSPLFPVGGVGGGGQWLQMTGALYKHDMLWNLLPTCHKFNLRNIKYVLNNN